MEDSNTTKKNILILPLTQAGMFNYMRLQSHLATSLPTPKKANVKFWKPKTKENLPLRIKKCQENKKWLKYQTNLCSVQPVVCHTDGFIYTLKKR